MTDLKFYVKYDERYKNGTEHNAIVMVRISPDKEAEAKASIFLPKGNLFGVDSTFLLKLPDMGSCSAKVVIMERVRKDYLVRNVLRIIKISVLGLLAKIFCNNIWKIIK